MAKIEIFPAGSANENKSGGWSALIRIGGGGVQTTNQRLELTAVIEALKALKGRDEDEIEVITDNVYISKGVNGEIANEAENKDLWNDLREVSKGRKAIAKDLSGGVDRDDHKRCLKIARAQSERIAK
ncbi:MAG: hypothetical protein LBQ52_01930 [Helicobacteraceae bacterium]|nr:hypothetical protein [Helicobacteraceae bacterium]